MERLPGASRASQPERDADRRPSARQMFPTRQMLSDLFHREAPGRPRHGNGLSPVAPPGQVRIFRVNAGGGLLENRERPRPADRGNPKLFIELFGKYKRVGHLPASPNPTQSHTVPKGTSLVVKIL